ncbi:MAG: transporter ATP-binding protein [Cohnella sp.]|jgi:ABC-type lipoprotein export system ATPase subunit|nr:transporter ATP-binding protein [Cohnella sp.]
MTTLVDARDIGCTYDNGSSPIVALESATCQVKPGDRIALVGQSGSGKSTLLQLLGGLETPTKGEIAWPALGDRDDLRPMKVGFVFQMQSLLAPLSVVENVELPLLLAQTNRGQARKTAYEELERIGLRHLADKLPEELSGGQAQRVAFARVMATRPQLILADEPTGQLDHPTAHHLFEVLFEALAGSDTALVVATHDRKVAERFDTLWTMKQGRLEANAS